MPETITPKSGPQYELPKRSLAGVAKAKRPGSDVESGQTIRNELNSYVPTAISQVRTRTDINDIIRTLTREDGLFSSASNSMVALASKSGFRVAGYSPDGTMNLGVMSAAYSVIDHFDTSHDYSKGFNDKQDIQALLATLMVDVINSGGCGAELIIDKDFGPNRLVPIGYSTITWESDGKGGRYPTQDNGDIDLNQPNIFIAEHNRNADEAYAVSQLRPGLSQTFQFNEFLEDTHRSVNRTGHSRLITTISQQAVQAMAPNSIKNDHKKMTQFYNQMKEAVEDALRGLEPEDALVSYDTVKHDIQDMGGTKSDYSSLLTTLGNLLGVSLKTPASVSGLRTGGGQALSNAETLIYLKTVEASRPPVEQVISRALTLAVRLLGIDGYVKFSFLPVNLRPETELEAYRGTKQKRILELLSYGIINDAKACWELAIRPQDLQKELAGTEFYNTNLASTNTERVSSTGRALNPGTPESSGGDDNE